jgi:hypothetical protein
VNSLIESNKQTNKQTYWLGHLEGWTTLLLTYSTDLIDRDRRRR